MYTLQNNYSAKLGFAKISLWFWCAIDRHLAGENHNFFLKIKQGLFTDKNVLLL